MEEDLVQRMKQLRAAGPRKPQPAFSIDDLVAELAVTSSGPEEERGLTVAALAKKLGCCEVVVYRLLWQVDALGELGVREGYIVKAAGVKRVTRYYYLKKKGGE